jgi:hypothetical protein
MVPTQEKQIFSTPTTPDICFGLFKKIIFLVYMHAFLFATVFFSVYSVQFQYKLMFCKTYIFISVLSTSAYKLKQRLFLLAAIRHIT